MTLYLVMIEYTEEETGYLQSFWAKTESIGEAIDAVIAEARIQGISCPIPRQVDPFDGNDLPKDDISQGVNEMVMYLDTVHGFPADDTEMILPYGVIPSFAEGNFDPSEIVEGYNVTSLDNNLIQLSIIVTEENLLETYKKILATQENYRVLMMEVLSHYNRDGINEVYVNENIASCNGICAFLSDNVDDIIRNGHVGIVAYRDQGRTNIKLTDHKMIQITGYDQTLIDEYRKYVENLGFPCLERFVNIAHKMHHWHFRPSRSRNKEEMTNHLMKLGFTLWKKTTEE